MVEIKEIVRRTPILGPLLVQARRRLIKGPAFRNSAQYWEERYALGGNSGAGSYSNLAEFKAEVLNDFVANKAIENVTEFGCGDGAQLQLAAYPSYTGYDISPTSVALCRARFAGDRSKRFALLAAGESPEQADLTLSLDVVYHLVEDDVFDTYMRQLFSASSRYVAVYSSNFERWESDHVRHRRFVEWVEKNEQCFRLIDHIPNRYPFDPMAPSRTSLAEFFFYERTDDMI